MTSTATTTLDAPPLFARHLARLEAEAEILPDHPDEGNIRVVTARRS